MRPKHLLYLSLLLACGEDPPEEASSTSTTTTSSADGSSSSGEITPTTGLPEGSPLIEAREKVRPWCEKLFSCNCALFEAKDRYPDLETCLDTKGAQWVRDQADVEVFGLEFSERCYTFGWLDPMSLEHLCLGEDAKDKLEGDKDLFVEHYCGECPYGFGTVPAGGACDGSWAQTNCAEGLYCKDGFCADPCVVASVGDPCPWDTSCQEFLNCTDGVCTEGIGEDGFCIVQAEGLYLNCAKGLLCRPVDLVDPDANWTCQTTSPYPSKGEPCGPDGECEYGEEHIICINGLCQPERQDGETCTNDNDCMNNHPCDSICHTYPKQGELCEGACAEGLDCYGKELFGVDKCRPEPPLSCDRW